MNVGAVALDGPGRNESSSDSWMTPHPSGKARHLPLKGKAFLSRLWEMRQGGCRPLQTGTDGVRLSDAGGNVLDGRLIAAPTRGLGSHSLYVGAAIRRPRVELLPSQRQRPGDPGTHPSDCPAVLWCDCFAGVSFPNREKSRKAYKLRNSTRSALDMPTRKLYAYPQAISRRRKIPHIRSGRQNTCHSEELCDEESLVQLLRFALR